MSEAENPVTEVEETPAVETTAQPVPSADTKAPDSPEEPKKAPEEPKKDEAQEIKAKQFAYLQRETRKQREREVAFKAEQEKWAREQEQSRSQLKSYYDQLVARSREVEEAQGYIQKLVEQARSNPIEWLSRHAGISPEEYVARVTGDNKPTPEFLLKSETERLNREWAEKYDALSRKFEENESRWGKLEDERKAWSEKQRQWQEEQQRKLMAEQAQAAQAQAQTEFMALLEANKAEYSDLLVYTKEEILETAAELVRSMGKEAERLSLKDIADELQRSTSEVHKRIRAAGGVQAQQLEKKEAAAEAKKPASEEEDVVQKVAASRQRKMQQIPKGQVRTAQTLNGDLAGRASVGADADDRESRVKKVLASL